MNNMMTNEDNGCSSVIQPDESKPAVWRFTLDGPGVYAGGKFIIEVDFWNNVSP